MLLKLFICKIDAELLKTVEMNIIGSTTRMKPKNLQIKIKAAENTI